MNIISPLNKRLFESDDESSLGSPTKKPRSNLSQKIEQIAKENIYEEDSNSSFSSPAKFHLNTPLTFKQSSPTSPHKRTFKQLSDSSIATKRRRLFSNEIDVPAERIYVQSIPRNKKNEKAPSIIIQDRDPLNPSEDKIVTIPGVPDIFSISLKGEGKSRKVYEFLNDVIITIDPTNAYYHKAVAGTYNLKNVVLKVLNIAQQNPQKQKKTIQQEIVTFEKPENQDPIFRPKMFFYGKDGSYVQEKVTTFDEVADSDPKACEHALILVKKLFEINIGKQETVIFDIRPRNIGFSLEDGRPLLFDLDISADREDFIIDLSKDLYEWMEWGEPIENLNWKRFDFLTRDFPDSIKTECRSSVLLLKMKKIKELLCNNPTDSLLETFKFHLNHLVKDTKVLVVQEGILTQLSREIFEWMESAGEQANKAANWDYLTKDFPPEVRDKCSEIIAQFSS